MSSTPNHSTPCPDGIPVLDRGSRLFRNSQDRHGSYPTDTSVGPGTDRNPVTPVPPLSPCILAEIPDSPSVRLWWEVSPPILPCLSVLDRCHLCPRDLPPSFSYRLRPSGLLRVSPSPIRTVRFTTPCQLETSPLPREGLSGPEGILGCWPAVVVGEGPGRRTLPGIYHVLQLFTSGADSSQKGICI